MYAVFTIPTEVFDPEDWDMDTEVTVASSPDGKHVLVAEQVDFIRHTPGEPTRIKYKYGHDVRDEWLAKLEDIKLPVTFQADRPLGSRRVRA